jgi:hypothetical protein
MGPATKVLLFADPNQPPDRGLRFGKVGRFSSKCGILRTVRLKEEKEYDRILAFLKHLSEISVEMEEVYPSMPRFEVSRLESLSTPFNHN